MFRAVVVGLLLSPLAVVACAGRDVKLAHGYSDPVAGAEGEGEGEGATAGEGEGEGAAAGEGEGEGEGST